MSKRSKARKAERKEKRAEKKASGGTKVGKALRKVKDNAKKVVNKLKEVGGFAVLIPFRSAMEHMLKAQGATPASKFDELVQQFHDVVVKKQAHLEATRTEHLLPVVISTVIAGIVGYFKSLKEKKESGAQMSEAENNALGLAESATDEIKDEIEADAKESSFGPLVFIVIVVVAILIIKK